MKGSERSFPPFALAHLVVDAWKCVMTIGNSPLKKLPPQLGLMIFLILSFMWSGIFASIIKNPYAFGWSAGAHFLVVCGIFITAIVFQEAEKANPSMDDIFKSRKKYNGRAKDGEHE